MAWLQASTRTHQAGKCRRASCSGLSNFRHRTGVTVRETKKDVNKAMAIVKTSGTNSNLAMPTTKKIGRKTTTVVTVEARIGMATSRAASNTACHRDCPVLRCRWMFSSSTIESSTNRPMPSASPPIVKTFNVCPVK